MNWKKIVSILILIAFCIAGWYFLYFIKTPAYSLKLTQDAIKTHNLAEFKKHVEVESIVSNGYDDMTAAELERPEYKNSPFKGLAKAIASSLKPALVNVVTDMIYQKVEGKEDTQTGVTPSEAEQIQEKTGINSLQFKEIGSSTITDGVADLPVVFHSNKLNQDITFNLKMKKLDDGTWQVFKIDNVKEYFEQMNNLNNQANLSENTN